MRAYVATTGLLFALLVVVHVWRGVLEGAGIWQKPAVVSITVVSAALSVWAWRLYRKA